VLTEIEKQDCFGKVNNGGFYEESGDVLISAFKALGME
jgi:hypothetical protein